MYDKFIVQFLVASSIIFVILGTFLVLFIVYLRTKQNALYIQQRQVFDNLNKEAEETGRVMNEVAKAVHDDMLQIACLLRMDLYGIQALSTNEKQLYAIKNVVSMTEQMIGSSRRICTSLHHDAIKTSRLPEILKHELESICETTALRYNISTKGEIRVLKAEVKLIVFRIAKEVFKNIIKHAGASKIDVILHFYADRLLLHIVDDGVGFSLEKIHAMHTTGLINMYQRAKVLNAELNIESSPGSGCTVTLSCPG